MADSWALREMAESDFGDKRLDKRAAEVLAGLSQNPDRSIPVACRTRSEMTAVYRFFDNERVTWQKVLDPHIKATQKRIASCDTILLVQDTTEINVTRPKMQVEGAGPLGGVRQGALLHPMSAFTVDGTPLGLVWADFWTRDDQPKTSKDSRSIEEKESFRWLNGFRQARDLAQDIDHVSFVCLSDSESDIYELFVEPRGETNPIDWIIRAGQDRLLEDETTFRFPRDAVLAAPALYTENVSVRGRTSRFRSEQSKRTQSREPRETRVVVRASAVDLRPPNRTGMKLPPMTVNVVLVSEVDPPEGEVPLEWLLLTTLPIKTESNVKRIVQYYKTRWMIEVLFRTLKTGCRVEERRFEHMDRMLPSVALFLIIAWRTMYVCHLSRNDPELNCESAFEPSEWKSVWMATKRQKPPKAPPPLQEVVCLIAQLGGYIKRRDPPGAQTIWIGLQRMHDLALAWDCFGPEAGIKDV